MGGGVALFDYDGDQRLDVYFINGGPLPPDPSRAGRNKLYRNLGDGRFEDATERAGVAGKGYGMGCAVGDYNGDGWDDLLLTGLGSVVLYRNRGDGSFEDVTESSGIAAAFAFKSRPWLWSTAAGFGDLDRDGDLDLFVVCYAEADPHRAQPCLDNAGKPIHCSPGVFTAQPDLLLRNDGGRFVDVSQAAGVADSGGRGLGLAIVDLDGDGLLDLFVANDGSPDFLYRNRGGLKFEDIALSAGAAVNASGRATASMGTAADDLDGDGLLDLFVTNFINEPNSFFKGLGQGGFADVSAHAGLSAPSLSKTGFGVAAFDADNDGRLDLFIANGHVDDQPWINTPMAQEPLFHRGAGDGRFATISAPEFARPFAGRGLAAGDLDGDGRVDLAMVQRDGPAQVWRNVSEAGHWLGVRVGGPKMKRPGSAIGAKVICKAGERSWTRWVAAGAGYLSRHEHESVVRFGLGAVERVDVVEIQWSDGMTQRMENVRADRIAEFVAAP